MLGSTKYNSSPPNSSCAMRAADASLSLECVGLHSGQSFSGSAGSASPFVVVAQGLSDTSRSDCAVGCDRISAQPDSSPLNSSYAVKAADVSLPPVCVGLHSGQSPSRIPMGTSTFVQGLSVEDQADAISRPSAEDIIRLVSSLPSDARCSTDLFSNSHSWQSGAWSREGGCGLRANTRKYPRFTSLVCRFIHSLMPAFAFQALAIFQNIGSEKRVDNNSRPGSANLVIPLSSFEEGSIKVHALPPLKLQVAKGPVLLDPSVPHEVEPWHGQRVVLAAYSPNNFEALPQADRVLLYSLGFRPPESSSPSWVMGLCCPHAEASAGLKPDAVPPKGSTCLEPPAGQPVSGSSDSDVEVISDEDSVMPALSHALPSSNTLTSDSVPCGQFLLDLCSGAAAPLSKAAQRIGIDVLPIDILVCHSRDLLQDSFYESLLRLAFSGRPRYAAGSPPCSEYSLLKQAPGGPRPCRSAEHLGGFPDNPPALQAKVESSRTLMQRTVQILLAVYHAGGHCALEQPRNSLAWREDFVQSFMQQIQADLIVVAACLYGMDAYKRWIFATSWRALQKLQGICPHARDHHPSFVGVQEPDGGYTSRATAMFPESLADAYVAALAPLFDPLPTGLGKCLTFPEALKTIPVRPLDDFPTASQDGGGIYSVPDWTSPQPGLHDSFASVRHELRKFFVQIRIFSRLRAHVDNPTSEPLFTPAEVQHMRTLWEAWFQEQGHSEPISWAAAPGQPYSLDALQALATVLGDRDVSLWPSLKQGVPLGVKGDIPMSHTLIPLDNPSWDPRDQDFQICSGNWPGAEEAPELLEKLIQEELSAGYLEPVPSLETAQQRWDQAKLMLCRPRAASRV